MSNIIKFPKALKPPVAGAPAVVKGVEPRTAEHASGSVLSKVFHGVITAVWMTTTLLWPLLKWGLSLCVVYHLVRTAYHWHTPGVHPGWTATIYFAVLVTLNCFVALFTPKGWKE